MSYSRFLFLFAFYIIFVSINSTTAFCNGTGSLRGFVRDSTNGESIIYANIVQKWTLDYDYVHSFGYKSILDPKTE